MKWEKPCTGCGGEMIAKWPSGKWMSAARFAQKRFCSTSCRNKNGPKGGWRVAPISRKGVDNYSAKLTEDQVRAIRKDRRPGTKVAHEYGVSKTTFYRIKRKELWKHIKD